MGVGRPLVVNCGPEPGPRGEHNMSKDGTHARAGQLPGPGDLVDVDRLVAAYYEDSPDMSDPARRVAFGTSGHRGSSLARTFTEAHVAAISQAVCRYRQSQGVDGPLFL